MLFRSSVGLYFDFDKLICRFWYSTFNDGQISKTDLLQVQSRLKEAELNKSAAYKDYQIALQNLNVLMGVPPMTPVEIADDITTVQPLPMHIGEEAALQNRPDFTISRLNVEYQKQCGADRFHACQRSPLHPITGRQGRTFPGTSPRYREPVRTNGGTDTEMGGETEKGVSIIFAFVSALDRELCRSKILLTNRYNLGTDFTENTEKINSSV